MNSENKYKEYSEEKIKTHKEGWDKDFFRGIDSIDIEEILFIIIGVLVFFYLSWGFKIAFIVSLIIFYWFKTKRIEKKIIEEKQSLILGGKFIVQNNIGRAGTNAIEIQQREHERGFNDYIDFLERQRNHLIARMIILNLFALVLLEIIRQK